MNETIEAVDFRDAGYTWGRLRCAWCGRVWVAVYPAGRETLQCPGCRVMTPIMPVEDDDEPAR